MPSVKSELDTTVRRLVRSLFRNDRAKSIADIEDLVPADFDDQLYLLLNLDVAAAGINPRRHYSEHGRAEGRHYLRSGPQPVLAADADLIKTNRLDISHPGYMRAAVYVHYDPFGIIHDYVINALKIYRDHFDVLIFISSADLRFEELEKVADFTDKAIMRDNLGYDFMSWRVGWHLLRDCRLEDVTFINDSVYGPNGSFDAFMQSRCRSRADLWGASISREIRPHVQSFFMTFGRNLIKTGFASSFWNSIGVIADKGRLIGHNELALSLMVERAGFHIGGAVDLYPVSAEMRSRVLRDNGLISDDDGAASVRIANDASPNPLQLFWNESIRQGGVFVKGEVLKTNPLGVSRPAVIEAFCDSGYSKQHILSHLSGCLPPEEYAKITAEIAQYNMG